jgi:hypothetical protein
MERIDSVDHFRGEHTGLLVEVVSFPVVVVEPCWIVELVVASTAVVQEKVRIYSEEPTQEAAGCTAMDLLEWLLEVARDTVAVMMYSLGEHRYWRQKMVLGVVDGTIGEGQSSMASLCEVEQAPWVVEEVG